MNILDQVTSIELSIRLKSMGAEQESLFYWCSAITLKDNSGRCVFLKDPVYYANIKKFGIKRECSAYTSGELAKFFPPDMQLPFKRKDAWYWSSTTGRHALKIEADARARFLIYHIEQGNIRI